jgi:hypothetical protein
MKGTLTKKVGNVSINCVSPEARGLIDTIMEEWSKHKKDIREMTNRKNYRGSDYGLVYWLVRWSGLVQPSTTHR